MFLKKTSPLLLIGLWLTSGIVHADSTPPEAPLTTAFTRLKAGEKLKVVTFGTSLTKYGYWVTAMTDWFQTQYPNQVTVVNSGGPGQNCTWGIKTLKTNVLEQHPDVVFIEFAYNDAVLRFKLTPEECKANLNKMVTAILAQNPTAAVILQTMNAPWDNPKGFTAATDRPQLDAFNENYRSYAKEHNLPLVDNYPGYAALLKENPDKYHAWVPDGSHPNKDASLALTWPNVKALLEKAQTAAK